MFGETPRSIHKNPYLKEADTHDWAMYQNTGFWGIVSGKIEKTVSILGRKVYSYHPMGRIIIPARTLNVLGLFHIHSHPPRNFLYRSVTVRLLINGFLITLFGDLEA